MNKKLLQDHNKWLVSMGVSTAKPKRPKQGIYKIPDYKKDLHAMPPTSDYIGNGSAKTTNVYTGSLITGIATMHKSNAVPVTSRQQAIDISNMRRN
tara:strand:+ start:19169 stop:19456 length:288 start_codon:yes stop_codon:yes gene_type:complete